MEPKTSTVNERYKGTFRKRSSEIEEKICEIHLDGLVESSVKAHLICEVIKYIAYQRGQIPMTYDQLSQLVKHVNGETEQQDQETCDAAVTSFGVNGLKKHSIRKQGIAAEKLQEKRRARELRNHRAAVESLETIFKCIGDVYMHKQPNRVAILLGGTAISPKEVYILTFPTAFYEGHVVSFRTCMNALFRTLISTDLLGELKPLKIATKMFVLVELPSDCNLTDITNIVPKIRYRLPRRGKYFKLNFEYNLESHNEQLSELYDNDFEISGIEPLEKTEIVVEESECFADVSCQSIASEQCSEQSGGFDESIISTLCLNDKAEGATGTDYTDQHSSECQDGGEPGFLWYQITVAMKGFKCKEEKLEIWA